MPKRISKRCELVKLCYINCSGPVFFLWHSVVFPHQTSWQYSDGTRPLNGDVKCTWGRQKSRSQPVYGSILCCERSERQVLYLAATDHGELMTLVAGSNGRGLLMAGDDDEVLMTRSLNVTPKTTHHHLIVRRGKYEAEVTNNKRLRSTYCTIEANYR